MVIFRFEQIFLQSKSSKKQEAILYLLLQMLELCPGEGRRK
jgi:hypothetical protein